MKKIELISPAGTLEKLKTAFEFGADAVYAGVPDFSLRARINDFTYAKMANGVQYAHKRSKKVYATLNIYAHNKHIKKVETAIRKYADIGVDGLIISDPGILSIARKIMPKMELHLSTQANCANYEAVNFWQKQGVKRIVLAREVSLKEIVEIHKIVPKIELEYFVHGAMCMSYSGRCILSKWLSSRSANLGECSQPCRWEYDMHVAEKEGKDFTVEEDQHGTYIFNSKDLCLIEHLDKLYKAGISSFKIEGRTKSAYYVAATAKLYRDGIDGIFGTGREAINRVSPNGKIGNENVKREKKYAPPKDWKEEIKKITNRGYTTGFLFGEEKCEHNFTRSHEDCEWQFVGEAVKVEEILNFKFKILKKDQILNNKLKKGGGVEEGEAGEEVGKGFKKIYIKIHNALHIGDEMEIVPPNGENIKMRLSEMYDAKSGEKLEEVHGGQGQTIFIFINKETPAMGMIRRKIS